MKQLIVLMLFISGLIKAQDSLVVHFPFDSDQLSQQETQKLRKALNKMSSVDRIVGYTDSIGSEVYNLDLSHRRAQSVKALLDSIKHELVMNTLTEDLGELPTKNPLDRKVVIYYQQKLSEKINSAKVGDNITLKQLNFEPGLDVLLTQSIPVLSDLLTILQENPKLKIAIEGHICCATEDDINLSFNRAKVVYEYLVNNGISNNRLSFQGFGSTKPIYPLPEKSEEERIQNRRVELRIVANK